MPVLKIDDKGQFAFPFSCNQNGSQGELDACALDDMYAANKALNAEVRRRWQAADTEERRLLALAETRWLAASKAFCDWSVDANRGGSIIGMNWPSCMATQADAQRRLLHGPRWALEEG